MTERELFVAALRQPDDAARAAFLLGACPDPEVRKLVESLSGTDPGKLEQFRAEYDALAAEYFEMNQMRQSYLMSRAVKV